MKPLNLDDLQQYSDVLRTRTGELVTVRFVVPRDAEALQSYFRSLSVRSRYNRLMGAISELPKAQLDKFIRVGDDDSFSVVATIDVDGAETIVGEARYAFDPVAARIELGLSVDDRWQGHGIGSALLAEPGMPRRRVRGRTAVRRYAAFQRRHAAPRPQVGLRFRRHPERLEAGPLSESFQLVAARQIPCATWRLAAENSAAVSLAR